jgi:hypothetical protein
MMVKVGDYCDELNWVRTINKNREDSEGIIEERRHGPPAT